MEKKPISHMIAGLIIAAILIVFSLIVNFTGQATNKALGWFTYLIIIIGIVIFVILYSNAKNNQVTFGNLFSYGFKMTAFITLVFIVYMIVSNYAFPEFKNKIMDAARQQMEDQNKMSGDQIDKAMDMMNKYYLVFAIGGSIVMMAIVGAISSLIGASVAKKKPVNPLDQMSM